MADRLDRLLHDAVIGRDDQHHDVGDVGATRPHRSKRLMARRIDKGDLLAASQAHAIGADVLRDPAGLATGDIGFAQRVEKRCLAVIDMAHDRDDRGPRFERLWKILLAAEPHFNIGLGNAPQAVPKLPDDEFGGVGVDCLIDRRHHAHAHQRLDHVGAALGHAVCQLLDSDRFGDDDLAQDLDLLLFALMQPLTFPFPGPSDRSQAAHPLSFVIGERTRDCNLSGPAARLVTASRYRWLLGLWARPAPWGSRRLLFLFLERNADLARCSECRDLGGRCLASPFGDLPPRFFIFAPLRLILRPLARFLFRASAPLVLLGPSTRLLLGPAARLLDCLFFLLTAPVRLRECDPPPDFLVGLARIMHGPNPARLFFGR